MNDLAVLGQDPRFGGGVRALLEAFRDGATELGRDPSLFHVDHPSLRDRPPGAIWPHAKGSWRRLARFDAAAQLAQGLGDAAELRSFRSVWVVAAVASHGYAAVRSGRAYACWLATGLDEEWAARRSHLPPSRRVALTFNRPVLRRLERAVLRNARVVYAISDASAQSLAAAAGLAPEQVGILPIPVDVDRFSPGDDTIWLSQLASAPTVAFVGRADDPRKGVDILLRAWPLVMREVPDARLRLIGRPPAVPLPEGVDARGEVASVAEELLGASLLVLPARQEGFGIAAAEALASGVPVVSTPSGGPEQLIRRSGGGRVLETFDAEELGSVIVDLLSSPGTLLRLRHAGRAYAANEHSVARFTAALSEAFARLDGP